MADKLVIPELHRYIKKFITSEELGPPIHMKCVPVGVSFYNPNRTETEAILKYNKWVHKGQRKLLMTEIQHLTYCLDSYDEPAIVVYIGAAPNNKAMILHNLFPRVKFLMIDPQQFRICVGEKHTYHIHATTAENNFGITYLGSTLANIDIKYFLDGKTHFGQPPDESDPLDDPKKHKKIIEFILNSPDFIFLNEHLATEKTGRFIKKLYKATNLKTIFWSDIRRADDETGASESDVIHDHLLNMILLNICKPDFAMIKFRTLFTTKIPPIDEIQKASKLFKIEIGQLITSGKLPCFSGTIYNQCWRGPHSSECRLWLTSDQLRHIELYDSQTYDNCNYFYNMLLRPAAIFKNPAIGMLAGLDRCADCSIEGTIWVNYLDKYGLPALAIREQYNNIHKYLGKQYQIRHPY